MPLTITESNISSCVQEVEQDFVNDTQNISRPSSGDRQPLIHYRTTYLCFEYGIYIPSILKTALGENYLLRSFQ
jgi:hypothetical protein